MFAATVLVNAEPSSLPGIDFNRDVQPILREHCFQCHGPEKQKNGLRFDLKAAALTGGDSGKAIVPRNSGKSLLVERIASHNPDTVMPPKGEKLSTEQIDMLKRWIDNGAEWPESAASARAAGSGHWSFQAPTRPTPPVVGPLSSKRNAIDLFILERLEQERISPSAEANSHTLIRRLCLDLLGLPPTREQVRAFVEDSRPDAYERLVDQLLASPHFGERWARHWLDLARYADSDGYEKDTIRPYAYLFRDWVIRALNSDMSFDRFTIEQLAGDLLPDASIEQHIATGFQRQTLTNKEGGVDQEEYRCKATVDRTSTVGAVWLGLTVGCAECHSHKYDPISQREFYQLFAFFNDASEKDVPAPQPMEWAEYTAAKQGWEAELQTLRERLVAHLKSDFSNQEQEWERQTMGIKTSWQVVVPASVESSEGTTLAIEADGTVTALEKNPPTDTYTIEFEPGATPITGLRLEALPGHDGKVGRANNGNFVLSELHLKSVNGRGKSQILRLTNALSDFAQDDYPVSRSVDGDLKTGWAISPKMKEGHVAVFELAERSSTEGRLVVSLTQSFGKQYNIGRFRLSVTTSAPPFTADVVPPTIRAALLRAVDERTPGQKSAISRYYREEVDPKTLHMKKQIVAQTRKEPKLPETKAAALAAAEPPRKTRIHVRGDFLRKGDEVQPATLSVLPPLVPRGERADRLDLARWLASPAHPLTARVAVNHIWKHLFGRGLVATVDDFGLRGERPSHPELLDWLATTFASSDGLAWSRKRLIKLVVMSGTYRQSSEMRPELVDRDPTNLLLARQNRLRLEAEPIRDVHLAASRLFVPVIGGPSVRPPLPGDIAAVGYANQIRWKESEGADRYRRGLYTFFQRTVPYPMLLTFDAPDSNVACTRRERSNTPLQALALLNDPVFFECAQALGQKVAAPVVPIGERIASAFEECMSRLPTKEEASRLMDLYKGYLRFCEDKPESAARIAGVSAETARLSETAACVALVRTIMNLDEFVSRD